MTRRAFTAGGLAAAAAVARPWPVAEARRTKDRIRPVTGVDLSNHPVPIPPNLATVCHLDEGWLNTLARRYWDDYARHLGRPLDAYDRADFWFRYLAIPLQKKAIAGNSLGTGRRRIEKDLALIHLVGYYGGIWFGKKLDEFTAMSTTAQCATPEPGPTEADFDAMTASLAAAIAAGRDGTDAEAPPPNRPCAAATSCSS